MAKFAAKPKWAIMILIVILSSQFIPSGICEPTWKTQVVDWSGSGGSIAIDSSGNPHIVYETFYIVDNSQAFGGVHYAVLTEGNWTIQTVDPSGAEASLVLDSKTSHTLFTKRVMQT